MPVFEARAQLSVGLQAGYGQNELYTDLGHYVFARYRPVKGYSVGVPFQYELNKWLAVQADLSFIEKSYKMERSDFYKGIYQTTTNSYLQLPAMAHFSFGGDRLRGFTNAGFFAAYWLKSHIMGVGNTLQFKDPAFLVTPIANELEQTISYTYHESYPFDPKRDQRWEAGWLAGAGITYQFSPSLRWLVEGRYYYSVTDMQKNYMIGQMPRYNQTWMVQTGILMSLTKH